jgi:hypothetical protein
MVVEFADQQVDPLPHIGTGVELFIIAHSGEKARK